MTRRVGTTRTAATSFCSSAGERIAGVGAGLRDDALAAQFVGLTDDRGLGHGLTSRSWVDRLGSSGWWPLVGLIAGLGIGSVIG